jgi:hypothetical protein
VSKKKLFPLYTLAGNIPKEAFGPRFWVKARGGGIGAHAAWRGELKNRVSA